MEKKKNSVLVSVIVVTYNSSKYILETLDSIYYQSYPDLELIISDDCSKDETVNICQSWISAHSERFVNVCLITSAMNTGVSANCNRAYEVAQGEWVKELGGDDILLPHCIEDYLDFVANQPTARFVFAIRHEFGNDQLEIQRSVDGKKEREYFYHLQTSDEQYWDLVIRDCAIHSCTAFIHRKSFEAEGGYDETIALCEDYPMWMKLTKKGYKMFYLPKETVGYRIHGESIVHQRTGKRNRNLLFRKTMLSVFKKYRFEALKSLDKPFAYIRYFYYSKEASDNEIVRVGCVLIGRMMRLFVKGDGRKLRMTKKVKEILSANLQRVYLNCGFLNE